MINIYFRCVKGCVEIFRIVALRKDASKLLGTFELQDLSVNDF